MKTNLFRASETPYSLKKDRQTDRPLFRRHVNRSGTIRTDRNWGWSWVTTVKHQEQTIIVLLVLTLRPVGTALALNWDIGRLWYNIILLYWVSVSRQERGDTETGYSQLCKINFIQIVNCIKPEIRSFLISSQYLWSKRRWMLYLEDQQDWWRWPNI